MAPTVAETFTIGPGVLVVGLIALVFAIFVIVDMARRPTWQWQRAGSSKTLWLVLEIVLTLLLGFLSILIGVLYLAIVRPKLVAVERQGLGGQPPWGADGGWSGTGAGWPGTPGTPPGAEHPWAPPGGAPPPYPGTGGPAAYPGSGGPPPYPGSPGAPAGAEGGAGPTWPGAVADPSPPPFGWYPDPSSRHELRYWDGRTWTEHVSDSGQQATDPLPG